jgi:hypothetical protein
MATLIEAYEAAKAGKVISSPNDRSVIIKQGGTDALVYATDCQRVPICLMNLTGWTIEEPQPEYEDCEVRIGYGHWCGSLAYRRDGCGSHFLSDAISDPDFIGYVYDGVDELWSVPVLYVSGKHSQTYMHKESDDFEPVRPTHVRFKK